MGAYAGDLKQTACACASTCSLHVVTCHLTHLPWVRFVQITNAPRSSGKEVTELHEAVRDLVTNINNRYGTSDYTPVLYLERHVPLHERIAFYTIADVAVVTATRDGMNLVPYEYVVCRQGPDGDEELQLPRESMLVVSGGPRGLRPRSALSAAILPTSGLDCCLFYLVALAALLGVFRHIHTVLLA